MQEAESTSGLNGKQMHFLQCVGVLLLDFKYSLINDGRRLCLFWRA